MTLLEFGLLLLVAGVCGGIAQAIVGFSRGGCLASVALGLIGALLGTWLSRQMELPELIAISFGEQDFPIVWSIVGASLFVALLSLISGGRRSSRVR